MNRQGSSIQQQYGHMMDDGKENGQAYINLRQAEQDHLDATALLDECSFADQSLCSHTGSSRYRKKNQTQEVLPQVQTQSCPNQKPKQTNPLP